MKLTKSKLKQIIKEELASMLETEADAKYVIKKTGADKYVQKGSYTHDIKWGSDKEGERGVRVWKGDLAKEKADDFKKAAEEDSDLALSVEKLQIVSERKLPPMEDPEIVAQWEQIKPALDQLIAAFKDSSTGPHHTMASTTKLFKNKIDGGMRIASYGELGRGGADATDYGGVNTPPQINEDVMDQNVIDGMIQIMNNFPFLWGVLAVAMKMSVDEFKEWARSYAAKKAGLNIKTQ